MSKQPPEQYEDEYGREASAAQLFRPPPGRDTAQQLTHRRVLRLGMTMETGSSRLILETQLQFSYARRGVKST